MQPENKPHSSELQTQPRKGRDGPRHRLANSPAAEPKSNAGGESKPSHVAAGHIQANCEGAHSQTPNQTVAANTVIGVSMPGAEPSPIFNLTNLKHYVVIAPIYCLLLHALSLSEHYENEGSSEPEPRRAKLDILLKEYLTRFPSEPNVGEYHNTLRNIYSLIATALQLSLNDRSVETDVQRIQLLDLLEEYQQLCDETANGAVSRPLESKRTVDSRLI